MSEVLARVRHAPYWLGTRLLLEFLALTVVRPDEARRALWSELDLEAATWAISAARMSNREDQRVPLSSAALAVLRQARDDAGLRDARSRYGYANLVFPGVHGRLLSRGALSKMLRDMHIDAVPHGFRHSFAAWAAEQAVDSPVAWKCLSLEISNRLVCSFRCSDLHFNRVPVMECAFQ